MKKCVMYLVVVLAVASWCGATVIGIEDFESYANVLALRSKWVAPVTTTTLSLDTTTVHGGTKSMKYDYVKLPDMYAKAEFRLPGIVWGTSGQDWTGTTQASIWYYKASGSQPFKIKLVDCWGNNVYSKDFGTMATGVWTEIVMDLTVADSLGHVLTASELTRIARIDIVVSPAYSSGTVYFDDITRTVPEPATMAVLSLGGLLLRKRK